MSVFTLAPRVWFSRASLWLALALGVILMIFGPLTLLQRHEAALLAAEGIDTSAEVVDHGITTSRRNGTTRREHHLILRFVTASGAIVQVRHEVSASDYEAAALGSPWPLRYAASDPEVTERHAGETARGVIGLALVLAGAGAGFGVALAVLWRSLSAQARALQTAAVPGAQRTARIVAHRRIGRRGSAPLQAEWLHAGGSGWTRGHRAADLPAIGADITLLTDPRTGRSWWEGDF